MYYVGWMPKRTRNRRRTVNSRAVSRPKPTLAQLSLRLPADWLDVADELSRRLSVPGGEWSRSDVLRRALALGLEALKEQVGEP